MVSLTSRRASHARGFFLGSPKCSCSLAPVRTRAELRQPVVSSSVQQAAFQTGWNTHFIPQSCHRNRAVVGTTHLPQELVLVGLSDDACCYKSSLSGGILKRTVRVHAHVPAGRFQVPFLRLFYLMPVCVCSCERLFQGLLEYCLEV